MKHILILAALIMTTGSGGAENCITPTHDPLAARTAKCTLSVDDELLVDQRCDVSFSADGREGVLEAGKYYARVSIRLDRRGEPSTLIASWNRGSGRRAPLTSLGIVNSYDQGQAYCFHNQRFEMCTSDYLTCDVAKSR